MRENQYVRTVCFIANLCFMAFLIDYGGRRATERISNAIHIAFPNEGDEITRKTNEILDKMK